MSYVIEAENISHSFAERQVLNQISFKVEQGEVFGLLGPSGAGKTTLIKILTGQLRQDGGSARILNVDSKMLSGAEHRQIGMMMDNFGLYERLSVYDNLAFYADICHVPQSAIEGTLESVGLHQAKRTAVSKLSKGMKNRLSLARALMQEAKILFLDEPTSGLDPATTREIHTILREQKERGTTIFLTTHNMYEAESLCDHVALLSKGSIIEYGNPSEICRKYNHLNRLQITLKSGEMISLENGSASAAAVKKYLEQELLETIHSTEPTLENVFIELTGGGLD
ncbi:MAG: heme ABC exporter ATP-binding protein CcmA [Lachnospiraceae bacterium]|nr:heme ABC exporter ATP-binding protein CcmA [Lachnospiraceae bacterium]